MKLGDTKQSGVVYDEEDVLAWAATGAALGDGRFGIGGSFEPQPMTSLSHSASRIILASPRAIFRAFLDPEALVNWRAPAGMEARLQTFDPRPGGGYRMVLTYCDAAGAPGKTTADSDVVQARFDEIEPDEKIVESIFFESDIPPFAGTMTLTTTMRPVTGGTKVTFLAENVPPDINQADHRKSMESSLKNLANLLE